MRQAVPVGFTQTRSGLGEVNPDSITVAFTQDALVGLAPTILESM